MTTEQTPDPLSSLRSSLDHIDSEIVRLIAERFGVVAEIGRAKEQTSAAIQDEERERRVLESVEGVARQLGVSANLVRRVFQEIISHSVARQSAPLVDDGAAGRVRVAYPGAEHSIGHLAAQKFLAGRGVEGHLAGHLSFRAAVAALLAGEADLAVLPIENTSAGSSNEVYALLREHALFIVGEETWKIDHCLAANGSVPLASLSRIVASTAALEQCAQFLQTLPQVATTTCVDGADAMRAVASSGDAGTAAIGPPEAAAAYGLTVLRHGIADSDANFTRFVVLAGSPVSVDPRVPCKTSLILVTRHEEGALLRCLEILSGSGHSMTKLESRPRPGKPWEYMFFLDFEGNVAEPRTAAALDELRSSAPFIKVLGSYPAKALRE